MKENYRRFACVGKAGGRACGFQFGKRPPAARSRRPRPSPAARQEDRPAGGFRSKAGWPFVEIVIKYDDEGATQAEFDFGDDKGEEPGELVEFDRRSAGPAWICGSGCTSTAATTCAAGCAHGRAATPSCTFKSGKIILQQPVEREQMAKLLETGKTDLLDKFVSMRTRRNFRPTWRGQGGRQGQLRV